MLRKVDDLLNSITMYRLTLYYLILLVVIAFVYSTFHILPFGPVSLILSTAILLAVCYLSNKFFEKLFNVTGNLESLYITALILVLIITPVVSVKGIEFLILTGFLAMASKYIINIQGKHIFNPVAIATVIASLTIHEYPYWWIGTLPMMPWVLLGILIIRKLRRYDLIFYFFIMTLLSLFTVSFLRGNTNLISILKSVFFDSPLLFFAFVMLTEPLTTPPTTIFQSIYGGLVGVLIVPIHIGIFYTTPELALCIGNIFSYLVSPKEKLTLKLKEKIQLTPDIYDFVFDIPRKLKFTAGQYMEWTLGQKNTDSRGNRRYFTLASSPSESEIRIGVKFPKNLSTFKREMLNMKVGGKIVSGQLAGDFTLPKNKNKKLVFIAGGIGITPFRSIFKYLIDSNEKRDIILIYCESNKNEMIYKKVFDEGNIKLGIKVIYFETQKEGHINSELLKKYVPDFKDRTFYLSGPHAMVNSFEEVLRKMNVRKRELKLDYFPGF